MTATMTMSKRSTRRNPAAAYPSPKALALDASLTRTQRIALLERWKRDLEARAEAVDEGMPPRPFEPRARPHLRDVALALEMLADDDERIAAEDPPPRANVPYDHIPFAPSADPVDGGLPATGTRSGRRPHLSRGEIGFWALAVGILALFGAPLLAGAAGMLLLLAIVLTRLPFLEG